MKYCTTPRSGRVSSSSSGIHFHNRASRRRTGLVGACVNAVETEGDRDRSSEVRIRVLHSTCTAKESSGSLFIIPILGRAEHLSSWRWCHDGASGRETKTLYLSKFSCLLTCCLLRQHGPVISLVNIRDMQQKSVKVVSHVTGWMSHPTTIPPLQRLLHVLCCIADLPTHDVW